MAAETETGRAVTLSRLPFRSLLRRPFRSLCLATLVALLTAVLFSGLLLVPALQNGLRNVHDRFGADLIVVPEKYYGSLEGVLLKGEPSRFYLKRETAGKLASISGVERLSPQLFLTSLSEDCCEVPVQLIGFDPQTDFSVQPWIREQRAARFENGAIIIGGGIRIPKSGEMLFFNRPYRIAAKLAQTGTGLDNAVFTDMDTLRSMMADAEKLGSHVQLEDSVDESVSAVLIKVKKDVPLRKVIFDIRMAIDGIQVLTAKSMMGELAESISRFAEVLYLIISALLVLTLLTLSIVFSVTAGERRKEFAVLRILGLSRSRLSRLLFRESALLGLAGGIAGAGLAAAVVLPFIPAVGTRFGLPYIRVSAGRAALVAGISLLTAVLAGPIASAWAVRGISRTETGLLLREGE